MAYAPDESWSFWSRAKPKFPKMALKLGISSLYICVFLHVVHVIVNLCWRGTAPLTRNCHVLCSISNLSTRFWKLKVDMPILTSIFFTFNWLTLTSEMHFVKFHPEVASCLLSKSKRKNAPLGMRLLWKYIRNYFRVYQLISRFLLYLQNYKEF